MTNREQPDPGEGWRLLGRGEVVLRGDQCNRESEGWIDVSNPGYVYSSGIYWPHRRRIPAAPPLSELFGLAGGSYGKDEPDLVNAPPHYRQGDIECIDAIRSALTDDEFRGFCKGNAIKYTWRERHKGGDEDLKKAAWYLSRIETKEATK